jgi:threonine dehydratase
MTERTPTPSGVLAAADRLRPWVTRTPLLPFTFGQATIWAKAECLQYGGSFKLRGATNRLVQLTPEERERGVVAFSSGNHALGIAIAARRLDISATIVMPKDAPLVKRDAVLAQGAQIVGYDRATENRDEIAAALAAQSGATLVPSFDDVDVIEGQGSAGVELAEQMRELAGGSPTQIIVPCGGGGLASGIALANPDAELIVVEPEGWADMGESLVAGQPVSVPPNPPSTMCDALMTPKVSQLTVDVLRHCEARALAVSDAEVARAISFAAGRLKLVLEPGGAVALAALLAGKTGSAGERTALLLSGGNVDLPAYAEILRRPS